MADRPRIHQFLWLLAAAGLFTMAGSLQPALDAQSSLYQINPPDVTENHPGKALLTMAPGGLRAPIVSYLWIRADELKNMGRHHEAMQLADLICKLQPNFEGVWSFHAWNMAWNISVMTQTPQERWLWVYNGVKLLRDQGIPLNRRAIILYKQLGWIFFNKMGAYMDDMHMSYKQRWAGLMQRLLASAPYDTTEEVIDAFRPIAEAPLDKDLRRQGKATIQLDQLEVVLSDPAVAAYADLLETQGIEMGWELLDAYNSYTRDQAVEVTRVGPPALKTANDKALSKLINSTEHSQSLKSLLAFVRAQVLWNVYKMDPEWMLKLMEKYGPLDWRLVLPHGLYWTSYGLNVCEDIDLSNINSVNTERIVLFCLKSSAWNGRLTYFENPSDPDYPKISWSADWRFIEPTHQEYILTGTSNAKVQKRLFRRSEVANAHVNFLIKAIQMYYAGYRREKAQELLDWLKENYKLQDWPYTLELEELVIETLNKEGKPIPDRAQGQITSALTVALVQQAWGNTSGYKSSLAYARRVYNIYQEHAPVRNKLPNFSVLVANITGGLIARPTLMGVNLPLMNRVDLYGRLDYQTRRRIYDPIAGTLQWQCEREGIDFAKAFPAPPGMAEYRAAQAGR